MKKLSLALSLILSLISTTGQAQKKDSVERFSYHVQETLVGQYASSSVPISFGHNTFYDNELKISLSSTFYLGFRLGKNTKFYINPDIAGGSGIGGTLGIAAYPNGEIFRVGNPAPAIYFSRAFDSTKLKKNISSSYLFEGDVSYIRDRKLKELGI